MSVNDAPADFKFAISAVIDFSVCFPDEPPLDLSPDGAIFGCLDAPVGMWVLKAIGEMRKSDLKWTADVGNNWRRHTLFRLTYLQILVYL